MTTKLEELALVACGHRWPGLPLAMHKEVLPQVVGELRVVLEALKAPTEDMMGMGSDEICKVIPHCKCPGDENGASDPQCYPAAQASWQAMLDYIIQEHESGE